MRPILSFKRIKVGQRIKYMVFKAICKLVIYWNWKRDRGSSEYTEYPYLVPFQSHRIIQIGRDLQKSLIYPPLQSWTNLYQVAQGVLQAGVGNLQGCRLHSLAGQPVLMFDYAHYEEFFFCKCFLVRTKLELLMSIEIPWITFSSSSKNTWSSS